MNERLYLLKITLQNIDPEIWRRFVVPADITLDRLHDVIQIVMGWEDCHLHEFMIDKKRYTEGPESKEEGLEEGQFRLCDLVKENGSVFSYQYDFGDSWLHDLTLENNSYDNEDLLQSPIECMDGERACPPEDIGGIPGYLELCRELNDLDESEIDDEEVEEDDEWYDDEYDSEDFEMEIVNHELMIYQRWSRDRKLPWGD